MCAGRSHTYLTLVQPLSEREWQTKCGRRLPLSQQKCECRGECEFPRDSHGFDCHREDTVACENCLRIVGQLYDYDATYRFCTRCGSEFQRSEYKGSIRHVICGICTQKKADDALREGKRLEKNDSILYRLGDQTCPNCGLDFLSPENYRHLYTVSIAFGVREIEHKAMDWLCHKCAFVNASWRLQCGNCQMEDFSEWIPIIRYWPLRYQSSLEI